MEALFYCLTSFQSQFFLITYTCITISVFYLQRDMITMYENIILLLFSMGVKLGLPTLRDHMLRVLGKTVLQKIFGPKTVQEKTV
jgi:hypothetical protein